MAAEKHMKTSYEVTSKVDAFFSGGKVQVFPSSCYCTCGNAINEVDMKDGKKLNTFKENDDDEITCFAVSLDKKHMVVATRALLLNQWDLEQNKVVRRFKSIHKTPILHMEFDKTSTLLATGSSDSTVKVYDIEKQYYTHNFKGSEGVITLVQFHPNASSLQLFSSADDGKIRLWNLNTSNCECILEGHFSPVTSLVLSRDMSTLVTCGRDRVIILWDMATRKQIKTVPVFEMIESIAVLPPNPSEEYLNGKIDQSEEYFVTAGEKGLLRVWNLTTGKCVYQDKRFKKSTEEPSESSTQQSTIPSIQSLHYLSGTNTLVCVTQDQNIVAYSMKDLKQKQQLIGYYDDILDVKFLGDESVVVASNSEQIKVLNYTTHNCQVLAGHTGVVLGVSVSYDSNYIASCSKDNTIMVWKIQEDSSSKCVAVGKGHTHAVDCVAWPKTTTDFVISGSKDTTLKYWQLPTMFPENETVSLTTLWTQKAHEKDINSVDVSPNDKLVASASQDKLVKIWNAKAGTMFGSLRGHKRGVWCVAFSTVDRCLATSSADSTIKIWALSDFTCVKSFEEHNNSVLRVEFITRGMQLVSSGSDGLIKIWTINENECVKTLDNHEDKVWALSTRSDGDVLVSGGGDSLINFWKDVTEVELAEEREKAEHQILQEQELSNLLHNKKYVKAIGLAITLDQPYRVLTIFKEMLNDSVNGRSIVHRTLAKLREDQLSSLMKYMSDWNTNAKHSYASQAVLNILLKLKQPDELMKFANIKETVEALLPYSERHYERMKRLVQQSTFVDYTWQCMKLSAVVTDQKMQEDEAIVESLPNDLSTIVKEVDTNADAADATGGTAVEAMQVEDSADTVVANGFTIPEADLMMDDHVDADDDMESEGDALVINEDVVVEENEEMDDVDEGNVEEPGRVLETNVTCLDEVDNDSAVTEKSNSINDAVDPSPVSKQSGTNGKENNNDKENSEQPISTPSSKKKKRRKSLKKERADEPLMFKIESFDNEEVKAVEVVEAVEEQAEAVEEPPKTPKQSKKTKTPKKAKTPAVEDGLDADSPKLSKKLKTPKSSKMPKTPKTENMETEIASDTPKIPKTPKDVKIPKTPKDAKTPKKPKDSKTLKTAKTPKTSKTPKDKKKKEIEF